MLKPEQQFILCAVRQALSAEGDLLAPWKEAALNFDYVKRTIINNGILLTVFPALSAFPSLQAKLHSSYYSNIGQSVLQDYEGSQILRAFNEAGLDCIALKGWEMRKLYPEITMRQMADLDILVRDYDYKTLKNIMTKLGYVVAEPESSWMHDSFSKGNVTVELHKRLTDDSGEIQRWETEMWNRTTHAGNDKHILRMSDEDCFIYHLIHMHKHFLDGSLGLRRIVDTWLFIKKHPEMDHQFLREQFSLIGLTRFADQMIRLSRAVMGEIEIDDNCETLLNFAFKYGINGTSKTYKISRVVFMSDRLSSGRARALISAVFMPYDRMKAHYPVLKRWPILLPGCWILRILQKLKVNRKRNINLLDFRGLSEENFEEMKRFFEAGGC